mmetsp:Transcript_7029/g.22169  ORF Transcript_7029/g.22169 Transcript_7029/m.22169 type:complete len:179 (+) Transcript_7029:346-882(+)
MRILFALAAAHAARLGSRKVEGRASPDENALVTRVAEVVRKKHDVMTWWSAGPTGAQVFLADRFADAVLDEKRCGAEGKWLACVDGKWRPEGVTVVSASSENGEAMVPVCELAASFDRAPHPYVTISVGENWAALSSQRINRTTYWGYWEANRHCCPGRHCHLKEPVVVDAGWSPAVR